MSAETCAICTRDLHGCVLRNAVGGDPLRSVHHACALLRLATSPARRAALAAPLARLDTALGGAEPPSPPPSSEPDPGYESDDDDAPPRAPDAPARAGTGGGEGGSAPPTPKCTACGMEVGAGEVQLVPGCGTHRALHWGCAEQTGARRRLGCPLCLGADEDALWDAWAERHADGEGCAKLPASGDVVPEDKELAHMTVAQMIGCRVRSDVIASHCASGGRVALNVLAHEMWTDSAGRRAILEFLRSNEYNGNDAAILGGRFEQLAVHTVDRALLLDRTLMPAAALAARPVRGSVAKMVRAGIDIGTIARAGYTVDELRKLGFALCVFIAAGGTREDLAAMDLSVPTLNKYFGLTMGIHDGYPGLFDP